MVAVAKVEDGWWRTHKRLSRRSPAKNHSCVQCAEPAHQWGHRPCFGEATSEKGAYCEHDGWEDCYVPMCRTCHRRIDLFERAWAQLSPTQQRRARQLSFRARIVSGGVPVRDALTTVFGVDVAERIMPSVMNYPRHRSNSAA